MSTQLPSDITDVVMAGVEPSSGYHYLIGWTGATLRAYKSTDSGETWNEVDSANRPTEMFNARTDRATSLQDTFASNYDTDFGTKRIAMSKLVFVSNNQDGSMTLNVKIAVFNMSSYSSPDTWESVFTLSTDVMGDNNFRTLISVRDSGDIVVVYPGAFLTAYGVYDKDRALKIVGSTLTDLGSADGTGYSSGYDVFAVGLASDSNNITWLIYHGTFLNGTYYAIGWRRILADYTFDTPQSANSSWYWMNYSGRISKACCFVDTGVTYVTVFGVPDDTGTIYRFQAYATGCQTDKSNSDPSIHLPWDGIETVDNDVFGYTLDTNQDQLSIYRRRPSGSVGGNWSTETYTLNAAGYHDSQNDTEVFLSSGRFYCVSQTANPARWYYDNGPYGFEITPTAISFHLRSSPPNVVVLSPADILYPIADTVLDGWTSETDSSTNVYLSIDDVGQNNDDYAKGNPRVSTSTYRTKLTEIATPSISLGWIVKYSYFKTGMVDRTTNLKVRLKCGSTTIVEWTHTDIGTSPVDVEQTVTTGQIGSITNWGDVYLEYEAY